MTRIFCYIAGRYMKPRAVYVHAIGEDGTFLASHISSSDDYAKKDIGYTGDAHRQTYELNYPAGYKLVWVEDPDHHDGLRAAIENCNEKHELELMERGGQADGKKTAG